jgi:hypothetical protein
MPTRMGSEARAEIQGAMTVAMNAPRNEDRVFQSIIRACSRPGFAEQVRYNYPRGGDRNCRHEWKGNSCGQCGAALISGPSVYLAREALRCWGNAWSAMRVIEDDDKGRLIEARAVDFETNFWQSHQDRFDKLIYRRAAGWVVPDEREMRELTNRRAALAERNAILKMLPRDLIDDALAMATETLSKRAAQDPDAERKRILEAFGRINVPAAQLEEFLNHKVSECSPAELANLRGIWKSIEDGNSRWADYYKPAAAAPAAAKPAGRATAKAAARQAANKPIERPPAAKAPADPPPAADQPEQQESEPREKSSVPTISEAQVRLFYAVAKNCGMNNEAAHKFLKTRWTLDHVHDIPKPMMNEVLEDLKTQKV